mmetsp:Transcript_29474/g.69330  ORF Transcript_29474/g.69330 Transcript_29474/m.69330 type:complete len:82 (+) Transcript_29474:1247-1492(+)
MPRRSLGIASATTSNIMRLKTIDRTKERTNERASERGSEPTDEATKRASRKNIAAKGKKEMTSATTQRLLLGRLPERNPDP